MSRAVLFCILACLIGASSPAGAAIYTYVDGDGVIHLTNVPSDSRYRPLPGRYAAPSRSLDHHIRAAARRYRLDPLLIRAVIAVESNFDHRAISEKGAMGLMQLMPDTARDLAVADPFDPAANIDGGARYLRQLLDAFDGDLRLALAAYNAGPNRVRRLGRVPRIPETRHYVRRVLAAYQRLQASL